MLALFVFGLLAAVGPATSANGAEFGIAPGGFAVKMLDAEGNPETRAGSHPDRLQIDFALEVEGTGTSPRDLVFELPSGLGGNLGAVPECPRQAHAEGEECPPDTQVGIVKFGSTGGPGPELPVFQLQPAPGQVAAFASQPGAEIPSTMELRPSDYGITLSASDLAESALSEGQIELWGIPADHQEGAASARLPFLTMPSVCGPLTFTFRTRSRLEGAPWLSADSETEPLTGCESLAFAPRLGLLLSNPVADSPTGLRIELSVPDEGSEGELAGAGLKDVTIELPAGLSVSLGGASKLVACSDAQLDLASKAEAACPVASKVGTMEFASPSLRQPLTGTLYLGAGQGADRFRLFVVASGSGIALKFVAALHPDTTTGDLVATLRDLPQVAISRLSMSLDGGPDALLATPVPCGPAVAVARFVPYGGGAAVGSAASVPIAGAAPGAICPGPSPFAPELLVSGSSHRAGQPSSFSATVRRRDGEQLPARFSITLPAGLSAALGAVQTCPELAAAAGACPAQSRLGSARADVGSGPNPAVLQGGAYLAGPYRRAPFSLVMSFRGAIGPFDLGTVAFRAVARIDARTGRVTMTTDRLPDQVEGVGIRFRTIEFNLDRPDLVRNPTSCGPHDVDATIEAQGGASLALASPFPVSGCKRLGFRPRVRLAIAGEGHLRQHDSVGIRVSTRLRRADTGLRTLQLSLPPALEFSTSKLKEICSRRDASEALCPAGSRVGEARARTALLSEPLTGSVYVVQPKGNGQPDIQVALAAMGVQLSVTGTIVVDHGHFVTRLSGLPDMPMSEFTMRLGGGKDGLLSLGADPCVDGRPRRFAAKLSAVGQNGAELDSRPPIEIHPHCGAPGSR